jgi:hypothetical protein
MNKELNEDEDELIDDEDEEEYGHENGDDDEDIDPYGEEDDDEGDYGHGKKSKGNKKGKKIAKKSIFASYEEFAHILEDGLDEGDNSSKKFSSKMAGQKRKNSERSF